MALSDRISIVDLENGLIFMNWTCYHIDIFLHPLVTQWGGGIFYKKHEVFFKLSLLIVTQLIVLKCQFMALPDS